MITSKTYKSDGTVETVTYENVDYFEMIGRTQESLMDELRQQRNQLLAQSDWMAVSDRVMTQAQIDYRQALRDLPATAEPQLDENGNLTNVTWPTYE